MPVFTKPEISDVYEFLRQRNALIVHFSGAPKGSGVDRGDKHLYPADLRHVLASKAMGGVSASAVQPGDVFHGFERNATGCIGVVLGLRDKDSLVAVDPRDCGSIEDESGNRIVQHEKDISIADLRRSFADRESYNEWVIRKYSSLGIFAAPPREVSILQVPTFPEDMPESLRDETPVPAFRTVSLEELTATFATMPIYTFQRGQLCRYIRGELVPVEHSEVYRLS